MEQPIAELVARVAPYALLAAAGALAYLALLSTAYAEARARIREYRRRRDLVGALDRHRPAGAAPSPRLEAAQARLEREKDALVRDGILPSR